MAAADVQRGHSLPSRLPQLSQSDQTGSDQRPWPLSCRAGAGSHLRPPQTAPTCSRGRAGTWAREQMGPRNAAGSARSGLEEALGWKVFSDASRSGQEAAPSTRTYPAPRPQQTLTWPPVRLSVSPAPKDTPQALDMVLSQLTRVGAPGASGWTQVVCLAPVMSSEPG